MVKDHKRKYYYLSYEKRFIFIINLVSAKLQNNLKAAKENNNFVY
ncbi:hypothetical protein M076_2195 [Bacteroides fragilis str. 2-F-2 |uniref:Uncharacterized protein n=1 Tax=Bacteroides fragilis str. 2-F-2 \|nr:hypothetical protein M076_2195 [Bacteroides fragilis str. 2-F-2 \